MLHELCHDVNGPLLCAHTIQLNQFRMCQLPEKIEITLLLLPPPSVSSAAHKTAEMPPPPEFIYNQYTASEAQDWKSTCQGHNSHHYFGFFNEVLLIHCTFPNCLDGHFVLRPPLAEAHHAEQTAPQLPHECQFGGIDFPLLYRTKQINKQLRNLLSSQRIRKRKGKLDQQQIKKFRQKMSQN